tara:strand:- start:27013 stop:27552 length:540 start_codon:yes stop_codon:yes gene_type:complete
MKYISLSNLFHTEIKQEMVRISNEYCIHNIKPNSKLANNLLIHCAFKVIKQNIDNASRKGERVLFIWNPSELNSKHYAFLTAEYKAFAKTVNNTVKRLQSYARVKVLTVTIAFDHFLGIINGFGEDASFFVLTADIDRVMEYKQAGTFEKFIKFCDRNFLKEITDDLTRPSTRALIATA